MNCLDVGAGDRAPSQCVDEGSQPFGGVELVRVDVGRQILGRSEAASGLELPHDPQLVAQPVVLDRLKRHRVLQLPDRVIVGTTGKALLLDVGDRPVRAAHGDDLADFWDRSVMDRW